MLPRMARDDYEKGLIRSDSGLFHDKGNCVHDIRHKDFWGGARADGVFDCSPAITAAIAHAVDGDTIYIPPGNWECYSPITINKYVAIRGECQAGYQSSASQLKFHGCDGFIGDYDYLTFKDLQLRFIGDVTVVDPDNDVFGKRGIGFGDNFHAVNITLENVHIYHFDTGLCFERYNGGGSVYHNIERCKFFYNQIGIATVGVAVWATMAQTHVRTSYVHGFYGRDSFWFGDQCLFESNGGIPSTENFGLKLVGSGIYSWKNCYFNDSNYVGEDVECEVDSFIYETTCRWFGPGKLSMRNRFTSPSIVPQNVHRDWTAGGSGGTPTVTNETDYTRIQQSAGTAVSVSYASTRLRQDINVQDIDSLLISFELKVAAGHENASFAVSAAALIAQVSGRQDSFDNDANWLRSDYTWSDEEWHRVNIWAFPRYGDAPLLDATEFNLASITASININSASFAANPLDAHIRNPQLQLFTKKPIGSIPFTARGTWTPQLEFGGATTGITYDGRGGNYVVTDGWCTAQGYIDLSSKGSATGNATIANLPLPVKALGGSGLGQMICGYYEGLSSAGQPMGFANSGSAINLRYGTATAAAALTNAEFGNASIIYFTFTYPV